MKILIATGIFPPDIGGPATYSKLLFDKLPAEGFSIKVLSYGEKSEKDSPNIFRVSRRWPKILRHAVYFFKAWILAFRVDTVFIQGPVSEGFPALIAAKLAGRKTVLKIVGDYAWEQGIQRFGVKELIDEFQKNRYGIRVEFLRSAQKWVAKQANMIVTPSFYLKKIIAGWGIPEGKIKVIYNAVLLPTVNLSGLEARKFLGIGGKIILSIGRLVPWKGFDLLIEIASELSKEIADLKLIVIGSGPEEKRLKEKALKLNAPVIFAGSLPQADLIKYLTAADVFVLNSSYEGLSHQILESMEAGVPVAVSNAGGNPEVVSDGENGILFPCGNRDAIKSAIKKIFSDDELRKKFVRQGKASLSKFSEPKMVSELSSLFKSLKI